MNNAQLDAVKDCIDTAAWHDLNKEDPATKDALTLMRCALTGIQTTSRQLLAAADKVDNTPEYDRIASLVCDLDKLECDTRKQMRRMGWREC